MKRDPHNVLDEPWMQQVESGTSADAGVEEAGTSADDTSHGKPDDFDAMAATPSGESDIEKILHSVYSEPSTPAPAGGSDTELSRLIAQQRADISPSGLAATVFLTALLAGPISVLGTFAAGSQGFFGGLYLLAGGPVIEEMMKLGGLLYLLEKKPWYVAKGWHIIAAACISAALFGVIENLVYENVYLLSLSEGKRQDLMTFRWTVTVLMHVGATTIGAIGLRKAWTATLAKGKLFDSQVAEPYIAAAVAVHAGYNALALLITEFTGGFN